MPHSPVNHKNKLPLVLLLLLIGILLLFSSREWYQALFTSASPYSSPLTHIKTDKKIVAITFDTEWSNSGIDRLLPVLADYQIKATFFVTGDWAKKYPSQLCGIAEAGHEIGNHSARHRHLKSLSPQAVQEEILECSNTIRSITGIKPTCFRPPYGEYGEDMLRAAAQFSMRTILWNLDSCDWKNLSPATIAERVLSQCTPGSILLFHSGALNTPEALKIILPALQSQGYEIVTVSGLLAYQGS